ncbi:hypothetical protein [Bathymodiolus platifrons methanotrophic gill symbiont]|uniref:hypothetical protein n=1 Tax=Bathymodiolus platifrons methanotrophic gill symbiont TaxID=113268 RepID=UPI001C8F103D|nr:hypothetical protein [Bathymodiolus platifrons methanotrophic gill symbiont]
MARTQDVWGAEGISGRVKFLPLAWAGMPKTSFRKNSDSPHGLLHGYMKDATIWLVLPFLNFYFMVI